MPLIVCIKLCENQSQKQIQETSAELTTFPPTSPPKNQNNSKFHAEADAAYK